MYHRSNLTQTEINLMFYLLILLKIYQRKSINGIQQFLSEEQEMKEIEIT